MVGQDFLSAMFLAMLILLSIRNQDVARGDWQVVGGGTSRVRCSWGHPFFCQAETRMWRGQWGGVSSSWMRNPEARRRFTNFGVVLPVRVLVCWGVGGSQSL